MISVNLKERRGTFVLTLSFDSDSTDLEQLSSLLTLAESMAAKGSYTADRAAMARAGVELLTVRQREREIEQERRAKEEPF